MREPTEMELRVAEAMGGPSNPGDDQYWLDLACIAIRAMREPTEDMVRASYYPDVKWLKRAEIFTAMVNAASPG